MTVALHHGDRDVGSLSTSELDARFRSIEQARRELAVLEAEAVAELDTRRLWRGDGHRSIRGLLRVVTDDSGHEICAIVQMSSLLCVFPCVGDDLLAGRFSISAARRIARLYAHPRVGRLLADVIDIVRDQAEAQCYPEFDAWCDQLVSLLDADGANADARAAFEARSLWAGIIGDRFVLNAQGDKVSGELFTSTFNAYLAAEFDKDWAWTQERFGDDACGAKMPRTDSQRRYDALVQMVLAAGSTPPGAQAPEPVVNLIGDPDTVLSALARWFGVDATDDRTTAEKASGTCRTASGVAVAPDELVRTLLAGHVRRVVVDSAGVVIDLGRRQRFFTGSARVAATLLHTRCIYPGCRVRICDCAVDHLHEHARGGATDQHNADPLCDWHNWWKTNQGYTISRHPDGTHHTYRPDGTEVT